MALLLLKTLGGKPQHDLSEAKKRLADGRNPLEIEKHPSTCRLA